ncbi:MAG: MotA/TolQ/ExbB proton channel family protein [SAR324 cluster bacterium]|nr:MotA/TolQ/ExbB proton channel family protein [SAR324 cluster bacterium]
MDLGSVLGLIITLVLIIVAMGSYLTAFVDIPSLLIVVGGTIGTMLIWFPLNRILGIGKVMRKAFFASPPQISTIIATIIDFAGRARREGILSLQNVGNETDDQFFIKGINLVVDGLESSVIEDIMNNEIDFTEERHKTGASLFSTMAALSPAMGMIGTLVGLVIMLQNLSDPDAIGPSMAIALITTFYGSLLANVVGLPISGKLQIRSQEEVLALKVTKEGVMAIAAGDNPRIVENKLNSYLSPKDRGTLTQ